MNSRRSTHQLWWILELMRHSKPVQLVNRIYRLVGAVSNCAVSAHALMWCGWKSQLPGWTVFGAVANRTYRAWGKYRITDLFSETSSNRTYRGAKVSIYF